MALATPLSYYLATLPEDLRELGSLLSSNLPGFHCGPEDILLCLEPVLHLPAGQKLTPTRKKAACLLLAALHAAGQNGSSALPLNELPFYFKALTNTHQEEAYNYSPLLTTARKMIKEQLPASFFQTGAGQEPLLVTTGTAIYTSRHYQQEQALKEALSQLCQQPAFQCDCPPADFATITSQPLALSEEQKAACHMALSQKISILAGGPGSGKTAVIAAILRLAVAGGLEINRLALAAPTGKAANRIAEAVNKHLDEKLRQELPAPQTLHRLLGYSRGNFAFGAEKPRPDQLTIVDEASMIDLPLMAQLLAAIAPEGHLLLVGDPQQLPPVGCATVFKDLCHQWQGSPRLTTLQSSFRMERGAVTALAAATLKGGQLPTTEADHSVTFMESRLHNWRDLLTILRKEIKSEIAANQPLLQQPFLYGLSGFSPAAEETLTQIARTLSQSIILSATNNGPRGVKALNQWLHFAYQEISGASGDLALGEPLICTKNDYFHNIFNGDLGFVANVQSGNFAPCLMAIFPHGPHFTAIPLETILDHIQLAHAITIHKSQGSEVDRLFLIMPETDSHFLTRELLYTAVTRARKEVVIYGEKELWAKGCQRQLTRYSGI